MSVYTLILSPIELACGVTLEQVAEVLPLALMLDSIEGVMLPSNLSPALCGAIARCALAAPASFSHLKNGYPIYVHA
jgi:hypothetical protein